MGMRDRWFAAAWDRHARNESGAIKQLRREAVGELHGRVLEIGVGIGSNWPYLGASIDYTGIESNAAMLGRARKHAQGQGRALDLQQADVQQMPFADESFDIVFATLTFCSVANPAAGLAEIRRVLKPGGEFRFLEHVRSESPAIARMQSLLRPLTRTFAGGCNWDRDTLAAIRAAGFDIEHVRSGKVQALPAIIGSATKPPTDSAGARHTEIP